MTKSIIAEGKTTNEAIENGLKQLKVSKNMVEIKTVESEEKRSFFSILTPRVVKVELTLKENNTKQDTKTKQQHERKEIKVSQEDLNKAKNNIEVFLQSFMKLATEESSYDVKIEDDGIEVNINGKNIGFLIGYRGDTLYALQTIISSVANKNTENRVRILLDIAGYKEKRIKTLESLADKIARTVVKTRKNVALEPMPPYERKIIHSRLQENDKVTTHSIGDEPRRKVIISISK